MYPKNPQSTPHGPQWNPAQLFANTHIFDYQVLELVCCKKQQKQVPDQLLVCGIGEL